MTGCNREGGKGRNEGSPPRPSVPPKLASLASFPDPPPQRTAVLPSKTRFTTKTGVLCFLSRNPPLPPPPPQRTAVLPSKALYTTKPPTQRTAILPSKALYTTKTGVLCFLSRTPPHPKDSCFALQGPLYHQNWRPLLPPFLKLPKPDPPPPERPEPEAALCCYRRAAGQSQNTAVSS